MDLQLNRKQALISASTAGIGLAIAKRLAQEGAMVIVNGRTLERVDQAIAAIREVAPDAELRPLPLDLSAAEGIQQACERYPDIDILINNLGIYEPKPFEEITDDDWMRLFEINVMSGVRLSRFYLPRMMQRNWGRIVFISSESGVNIPTEMIHYGMTKSAQLAIARGLAEHAKGTQVTVNSVLPGPTWSEGVEQFIAENAKAQGKTIEAVEQDFFQVMRPSSLIQRFATADEVANLVAYVVSPLASATTGAPLRVEGGCVRSIV